MDYVKNAKLMSRMGAGHTESLDLRSGDTTWRCRAVFPAVAEKHDHLEPADVGGALLLHDYSEVSDELTAVGLGVANDEGEMPWWLHLDADEAEELGALLMVLAARKRRNS